MRPTGIAVDRDAGLLYIMDTIAHCVHVYTAGGQHKFSFGKTERPLANSIFRPPSPLAGMAIFMRLIP